ncbi:MAG: prepilin-type N-terminal cleavage/methylation domain-containing protein, partial [bacterium]
MRDSAEHGTTRHHKGFTLVEILMVLAIIGIATIVAMPSLVKSIRGNRLRMGARAVVMAGTYAHTMAILRNQEMKLVLDREGNRVTVEQLRQVPVTLPSDQDFAGAPLSPDSNSGTNEPSPGTAL